MTAVYEKRKGYIMAKAKKDIKKVVLAGCQNYGIRRKPLPLTRTIANVDEVRTDLFTSASCQRVQ